LGQADAVIVALRGLNRPYQSGEMLELGPRLRALRDEARRLFG
jgi:hypothetical protein